MLQPLRIGIYLSFFLILAGEFGRQPLMGGILALVLCSPLLPRRSGSGSALTLRKLGRLVALWSVFGAILLKEILISNLQVAAIVLNPRSHVSPRLIPHTTTLQHPGLIAALCTAITLTPGTMTVDVTGTTLKIHCLTEEHAAAIRSNPLEPQLLRIQEVLHG